MGSFGPMRVLVGDGTPTANAPFNLVENQYSLLDRTDLVFVDAPDTGFSRIAAAGKPSDFFGVDPDVVRLLPDHHALERELYRRDKIFPIMHLVAIRRAVYEKNPWIAASLYAAFVESKRIARARLRYAGSLYAMLPWLQDEVEEIDQVFPGGDPFPYGVEPNRPTLQALVQYMVEQHFIAEAIPVEELFVPLPGASGT